jgi:hypothetical protein
MNVNFILNIVLSIKSEIIFVSYWKAQENAHPNIKIILASYADSINQYKNAERKQFHSTDPKKNLPWLRIKFP